MLAGLVTKMNFEFNKIKFKIVGCARDCGHVIRDDVLRICQAFKDASSVEWLICESDSQDNTVKELEALQQEIDLRFITLGDLRHEHPKRTDRLALCRNTLLREIFNSRDNDNDNDCGDIDYIVVVDLDGINSQLTSESVKKCWELEEDVEWDACFANQSGPYYDIWALRHNLWSPNDCWKSTDFLEDCGMGRSDAELAAVLSRMITVTETKPPIEVDSAFGGLGIYRKDIIKECYHYVGLDKQGNEVCEHVSFHQQLKADGARLFIVPSLINGKGNKDALVLRQEKKRRSKKWGLANWRS